MTPRLSDRDLEGPDDGVEVVGVRPPGPRRVVAVAGEEQTARGLGRPVVANDRARVSGLREAIGIVWVDRHLVREPDGSDGHLHGKAVVNRDDAPDGLAGRCPDLPHERPASRAGGPEVPRRDRVHPVDELGDSGIDLVDETGREAGRSDEATDSGAVPVHDPITRSRPPAEGKNVGVAEEEVATTSAVQKERTNCAQTAAVGVADRVARLQSVVRLRSRGLQDVQDVDGQPVTARDGERQGSSIDARRDADLDVLAPVRVHHDANTREYRRTPDIAETFTDRWGRPAQIGLDLLAGALKRHGIMISEIERALKSSLSLRLADVPTEAVSSR